VDFLVVHSFSLDLASGILLQQSSTGNPTVKLINTVLTEGILDLQIKYNNSAADNTDVAPNESEASQNNWEHIRKVILVIADLNPMWIKNYIITKTMI
jgi:predicted ATPase with chaperone activity